MAKWRSVTGVATAAAIVLVPLTGVSAEDDSNPVKLLTLDGPKVDIAGLHHENISGLGLAGGNPFGPRMEFGVILWDEFKPVRPDSPSSQPRSVGGGHSTVSTSIN